MSNVAIQAAPGMTVQVAVPAGCNPGDTIMVDPDGPAGPQPPIPVTVRAADSASARVRRGGRRRTALTTVPRPIADPGGREPGADALHHGAP